MKRERWDWGGKTAVEKKSDWIQNGRMVGCVGFGSFYFHQSEGVSPDLPALKADDWLAAVNRQTAVKIPRDKGWDIAKKEDK